MCRLDPSDKKETPPPPPPPPHTHTPKTVRWSWYEDANMGNYKTSKNHFITQIEWINSVTHAGLVTPRVDVHLGDDWVR